jgi:tetratricopeptide (TPR) repeat protein
MNDILSRIGWRMSKNVNILIGYWLSDINNIPLILEIISQLGLEGCAVDVIKFINKLTPEQRKLDVVVLHYVQFLLRQSDFINAQQHLIEFQPQTEMAVAEKNYFLGLSHFLQRDYLAALDLLGAATIKSVANLKLRARILYLLARRAEALQLLQSIANEKVDAETLGLMSLILVDEAQEAEAVPYAEAALAQDPSQVDALIALATSAIQQQQFELAPKFVDAALVVMPGQGRVWSLRGQCLLQSGQLPEAETALLTAVHLMPDHVGTQLLLGWSLWLQEKYPESVVAFQRSVDMDRTFAESHAGLAVGLLKTDAIDEASRCVMRAVKLNPQSLASRYAQALLLEHEGQYSEATQKIDEIMLATHYLGQNSNLDVVQRVLSERQGR